MPDSPLAIEVRDVHKKFLVPVNRNPGSKALLNPIQRRRYRELHVLNGISFDVGQGEFFGIVGRNGSGKSTLLKLIASIYRADGGHIRVAGRLAPFLELGVGFDAELAAKDNVLINGVMMGLTQQEAEDRFDDILDFAGLQEFREMELKNYSSGMRVRLAFAMLVQIESDILLIDEVLAVGDANFQAKCFEAFTQMRKEGRTLLLVTHSMAAIQSFCDRAMLIHDGKIDCIGDTEEVTSRYTEINFEQNTRAPGSQKDPVAEAEVGAESRARVIEFAVEGDQDERAPSVPEGEAIQFHAVIETTDDVKNLRFRFQLHGTKGGILFAPDSIDLDEKARAGERYRISIRMQNALGPGPYQLKCGAFRWRGATVETAVSEAATCHFAVHGPDRNHATILSLENEVVVERETAIEAEVVRG
jgi:ABC-2 type transport system ATP-binding protein